MDEEFFGFGGFGDGVLDCAVGEGFHLGVLGLGGLEHLVDYLGGYLGDFGVDGVGAGWCNWCVGCD